MQLDKLTDALAEYKKKKSSQSYSAFNYSLFTQKREIIFKSIDDYLKQGSSDQKNLKFGWGD